MKKPLLMLFFISFATLIIAQENASQKEVGLIFRNFDNFGLSFKTGNDNSMWRFNGLLISGSNDQMEIEESMSNSTTNYSTKKTNNTMGFSLGFGKEFRKPITDNMELRYGTDVSFGYTKSKSETKEGQDYKETHTSESTIYRPGINLVFGLNYKFNSNIIIGAELLPNFSYATGSSKSVYTYSTYEDETKVDISAFYYGLSNSSAVISIAYRF